MEKGNAVTGDVASLVGAVEQTGLVERATSVTTVVTGMGAQAAETLKDSVISKASDAAVDEARERIRQGRDDQQPPSISGDAPA